jgi:hypothetical protein
MNQPARRVFRLAPAIAASALVAGALLATPLTSAAAATDPTPAPTASAPAATDAPGSVTLSLSPSSGGVVNPGADLVTSIEVTNSTSQAVPAGSLQISIDRSPLDTDDALGDWIAAKDPAAGTAIGSATPTTAFPPGSTHVVQVTIPADQLQLGAWGAYGLGAQLSAGGAAVASSRSSIVWTSGTAPAPAQLTVVAPITTVPSATGLIGAPALATFTGPSGMLTRELDAVIDRPVTIAIDPRIIVSIRALGSTAPASAHDWLSRLSNASNPIIPLTFGDSDISGEHQAGAGAVLAPTSFAYALDPANFTTPDQLIDPTGVATTAPGGSTPTPTPTPTPTAVPSLAQLTNWNYTSTSVAWPLAGAVVGSDLPFFAQSGLTTSIVDSAQLKPADGDSASVATTKVGDQNVLVADHTVSAALQAAVAAGSDTARGQAVADLSATLAVAAENTDAPGGRAGPRQLLAVLDRTATSTAGLDQTMSSLQSIAWASLQSIGPLLAATPTTTSTVVDAPEPADRISQIAGLFRGGQNVSAFSSILQDPSMLTGESQAVALALLSNGWTVDPSGWSAALSTASAASAKTLGSVQVVEGSTINMVANLTNLPITVSNDLPYAVNVVVHVTPSNGRLLIEQSDVPVLIEASSRKTAQIPVKAGVANGSVTLNIELLSPTGVLIGAPSMRTVNVSADWETIGTAVIGVLVVLLFGFGIVRNVLRRRRRRAVGGGDTTTPPPTGGGTR